MRLIPDLFCILICFVACFYDLRTRRIPNWLTLTAVICGLLLNTALFIQHQGLHPGGVMGLATAVLGGLLLFLCFGLLGALRLLGMGDVKLLAGVGTLIGWPAAIWTLAYVTLAGGVVAVGYAMSKGWMGQVLRNICSIGKGWIKASPERRGQEVELHRIPYALAILLGVLWTVAAAHFPALQIP